MSEEVSEAEFVDAKSQDGEDTLGENIDESKSNSRTMTKDSKEMDEADTAEVQIDEMEIAGDGHSFMCGVVEGFYGRPWTAEQRRELFRRMEEMGLNTYLYGPKDDYKHRLFWREKYSEDEAEILKTLINEAHLHGIVFVYAISPGLDMVFGAEKETNALKEKLTQVKELGCKAFALLFDDIDPVLCAADMKEFDSSANAQAAITNTMFKALDRPRFIFCPTEYCSSMAIPDVENSPYLRTLGTNLDPQISVMWTGAKVVSNIITVESIKLLNGILRRKVMIWDNIHANDYDPKRVFLGPFKGRSTHLIPHLSGVLTNPNCEFESNFVAMHTIASWYKSFKARPKEKDIKEKNDNSSVEKVIDSPGGEPIVDATMPPQIEDSHDSFPPDSESADSSSDQKSDSESDTDSDYSSHEGVYFPSLSIDEHGDYDPNLALEKALKDWLPVFSWIRYPSCKIIPRSGMQPALPRIPTLPITTHSHLPIACVTKTVMVPVSSVGKPDRTPPISASNPIDNDTESMRDTVKDDTLTLEASNEDIQAEKPESEIAVKLTAEVSDAVLNSAPDTTNDVVMCNLSKESAQSCDSVSKVSQGDSSGIPTNTVPDVSVEKCETVSRKMSSSADIEMNEESLTEHVEEKKLEDMQIEGSPKPATSQDQMETEDIQEPSTPMQTDDVDSDISMATAQSCTAISVDEITTPSPDCPNVDQSEIKLAELSHKVTFAKVENTKTTDTDSNNDMCTPVMSKKYKSSLVSQLEANPITVDDLRLLVQCFYLPYEHGELGKEMVQKFKWLKENAIKLSRAKDKKSEDYLDKALEWSRKALVFDGHCRDVQQVFNKLCICPNRALLYDIFPYLWDMKGVVTMLRSYVKWLGRIEVRPETPTANDDNKDSTTLAKPAPAVGFGWLGADPEPWAFRGGLSGEFQKLLPIGAAFDLFRQTLPLDPQVSTFIIRPYLPTDEQAVVDVCYATHNDGLDSDVFINHKQLPADKFVGALVTLSPEYCFVVEDDDGLCGYLAATLDAKTFWKKYELAYLPEMREKYEKPADSEEEMTEVERMIVEFHSTEDRFNYGTDELSVSHPSLMALALHPRASCDIAKSMTVCLLSALKSHHSCGVHVLVPQDSGYFLDLYTKLGFVKVYSDEDCTSDTKKLMILGRTF